MPVLARLATHEGVRCWLPITETWNYAAYLSPNEPAGCPTAAHVGLTP